MSRPHSRLAGRAALAALALLYGSAAFAPFLANERPYLIEAVDHGAYARARTELARPVRALLETLEAGEAAFLERLPREARTRTFEGALWAERDAALLRTRTMRRYLPPGADTLLIRLESELDGALASSRAGQEPAAAGQARAALATARLIESSLAGRRGEGLQPRAVTLVPARSWPLFASLSGLDLGAALCFGLLLAVWLGRRRLRRPGRAAALALAFGLVAGAARDLSRPAAAERDWKGALAAGELEVARALYPPLFMGFAETDLAQVWLPPAGGRGHALGTDGLGRDLLVRLLWGGRVSLTVGLVSAALLLAIGVAVGALAGYHGGRVDLALSRVIEVFQCFPTFFLIVTAVALIPEQQLHPLFSVVIVIALVNWTGVARLVRAEFLRARELDYVAAARSLGFSTRRIVFGHVLPNVLGPVLVAAAFAVASGVLIESGVSFLGFGVRHPVPSWGALLSASRSPEHWWLQLFPGLLIFVTVLSIHVLGERLRAGLDPRAAAGEIHGR